MSGSLIVRLSGLVRSKAEISQSFQSESVPFSTAFPIPGPPDVPAEPVLLSVGWGEGVGEGAWQGTRWGTPWVFLSGD